MTNAARKLMQRVVRMTLRDLLVIGVPMLVLIVAAFWAAYQFVQPAPPRALTISTGAPEGSYHSFAVRYKDVFERNGIELVLKPSAGAVENLQRLLDPASGVDVAFVQGGTARGKDTKGLVSLGIIYPEPLWIFYRSAAARSTPGLDKGLGKGSGKGPVKSSAKGLVKDSAKGTPNAILDTIDELKGKRIAIGPEGSGTRLLALELLEAHGIAGEPTVLLPATGLAAAQALAEGSIDVAFMVGAAQSGAVWSAFYTPGVEAFNFAQAEAYTRRFPYLSMVTLPRGAIDFQRNIPQRDITLVAPMASLVAREDVHPALIDLLLQAASEVHGEAGLFQKAGQFPTPAGVDIPLSKEAERYYKSGKPFLQRYLPFWAATLIDRLIVLLVPVIAILFPLVKMAPYLYSWRVRSRVFRYYGELKLLELQAEQAPDSKTPEQWLAEVDRIEEAAHRIPTPTAFADQVYTLRAHVHMVRKVLLRRFAPAEP